jgi:hypothetical protein
MFIINKKANKVALLFSKTSLHKKGPLRRCHKLKE